jgi:4a-hydroxytetrahydrobiopterin dehydratase
MSALGRPKREYRSAQHEGPPPSAPGRPKREYRSAQHEGPPVSTATARSPLAALADERCRAGAPLLPRDELAELLAALGGWTFVDGHLEKTFRFADYFATIAFVNVVAFVAHRENHHPQLAVHCNGCTVVWSTHDAGGVTRNDCVCAAKVERLTA